jgi:methionine-rich copper-binding protein CopC
MSVGAYLESEVVEKKRSVLTSSLLRKFNSANFFNELNDFLEKREDIVPFYLESQTRENGSRIISVSETKGSVDRVFLIKPVGGEESTSAIWKRDIEEVKTEMVASRPSLWTPKYASVSSDACEVRMVITPTPVAHATVTNSSVKSTQASVKTSKPAVVSAPAALVPEKKQIKYEIPKDRLDDPDQAPMKSEETKENGEHYSPEVLVEASPDSPVSKRQKVDAEMVASSEPQYREVTIKKKVIVTEYEMGPSGEMIVKDVEKMVEETKMELVKPVLAKKSAPAAASQGRKDPKPAKPGQGTLTGFFKPKN